MDTIQKIMRRMIGKKLQKRRIEKGFALQNHLAAELKIDPAAVSRWERGEKTPRKIWPKLVELLELTEEYFVAECEHEKTYEDLLSMIQERDATIKNLTKKLLDLTGSKKNMIKAKMSKRA